MADAPVVRIRVAPYMPIRFDIAGKCEGYPADEQFAFRSERCCVVTAIDDALRKHKIRHRGFQKIFIDIEPRLEGGLRLVSDGLGVLWISWPFDFRAYFSAKSDNRIRVLGAACVAALLQVFQLRKLSDEPLRQALREVENADFQAEIPFGKEQRSPDKRRSASLSYKMSLNDCTVSVRIKERKSGSTVLKVTLAQRPASFGLIARTTDSALTWISNDSVRVFVQLSPSEFVDKNFMILESEANE